MRFNQGFAAVGVYFLLMGVVGPSARITLSLAGGIVREQMEIMTGGCHHLYPPTSQLTQVTCILLWRPYRFCGDRASKIIYDAEGRMVSAVSAFKSRTSTTDVFLERQAAVEKWGRWMEEQSDLASPPSMVYPIR